MQEDRVSRSARWNKRQSTTAEYTAAGWWEGEAGGLGEEEERRGKPEDIGCPECPGNNERLGTARKFHRSGRAMLYSIGERKRGEETRFIGFSKYPCTQRVEPDASFPFSSISRALPTPPPASYFRPFRFFFRFPAASVAFVVVG